jgi:ribosomal protein S27AE
MEQGDANMNDPCTRCGSTRIIPEVPLLDRYGDAGYLSKTSNIKVAENPEAWFLKNTKEGAVHARICGDCGYTELHTNNHRELYEAYLKANRPQA